MILFLTGTPGIGKTTVSKELTKLLVRCEHQELDDYRDQINQNPQDKSNLWVEDAINWQVFKRSVDLTRQWKTVPHVIIIDSTGISKRYPYLRFALGDYKQIMVRLYSTFPYGKCQQKYGDKFSQPKFDFFAKEVMSLQPDYSFCVDNKTPNQLALEIIKELKLV